MVPFFSFSRIDDIFKTVYKDDMQFNCSNLDISYEDAIGHLHADLNFEQYDGFTRNPTRCLNGADIAHCMNQACMIASIFMIEKEFNIEFNENIGDHVLILNDSTRYKKPVFRRDKHFMSINFKRRRKVFNNFKRQLYVNFHGTISDFVDFDSNWALVGKNIHG
jgi:hypothetical protein